MATNYLAPVMPGLRIADKWEPTNEYAVVYKWVNTNYLMPPVGVVL